MRFKAGALGILLTFISSVSFSQNTIKLNDINWPPYFFPSNNKFPGIGKTLLNLCATSLGYQFEYQHLPIKRTHAYIKSGKLDVVVYSYKSSRSEFVHYGKEPLFFTEYGFVTKAGNDIEINSFDDLESLSIGHLSGLAHTPELMKIIEEKKVKNQVREGFELQAMFTQMIANPPQFDVMPNSKSTFYWVAKEMGIGDQIKVLDYTIKQKPYFVTVSKNTTTIDNPKGFIKKFDECIREIKASGNYKQILADYGQ